ncbi:hypothetical protein AMS68_007835 [Peltaster fructicola]|uniref:F-box domain-containing protein n=1 Tax=Peltaster fructicola TaxID=286661 RepID=A0A6H0Y639_9PEZI|nr:hypothetical protein AMS68_007835 [Peltaster fructicola]
MKRRADDEVGEQVEKRQRLSRPDRLSSLSDELVLRILTALDPSQVCVCQRLSHRFSRLASDSSIWRTHYFERFVQPRSSRLPGLKTARGTHFATTPSKWLDEQHLLERDAKTDWKKQYKLRHNWSRGTCGVDEITVAERPHNGLRAWPARGQRRLLAQVALNMVSPPTTMTVGDDQSDNLVVAVGFEDGTYHVYRLAKDFSVLHRQASSDGGVLTSLAMSWPYLLTMSATQRLTLYGLTDHEPKQVHSLKAHNVWTPLSVSLRHTDGLVISIAYALPTYLSGWTVGVQEIRLSIEGEYLSSRTASAIDQHYRPLALTAPPMLSHLRTGRPGLHDAAELRHIHSKPNSLSYTHPYLLVSHPDNTLTLYLVFSSVEELTISPGSRLWGHTSSVSGAHVGGRGKAVSISRRGDELRIWELEGGFSSDTARKRLASRELSVRVKPALSSAQSGLDVEQVDAVDEQDELTITRGWIGFDAENVAVLREESSGEGRLEVACSLLGSQHSRVLQVFCSL